MGLPMEVAERMAQVEASCKQDSLKKLRAFTLSEVTGQPATQLPEAQRKLFDAAKRPELIRARILAAAGQHARGGLWRFLVDEEKFSGPFAEMVVKSLRLEDK